MKHILSRQAQQYIRDGTHSLHKKESIHLNQVQVLKGPVDYSFPKKKVSTFVESSTQIRVELVQLDQVSIGGNWTRDTLSQVLAFWLGNFTVKKTFWSCVIRNTVYHLVLTDLRGRAGSSHLSCHLVAHVVLSMSLWDWLKLLPDEGTRWYILSWTHYRTTCYYFVPHLANVKLVG